MAGISQKIGPEEVLPLLARNVVLRGYSQHSAGDFGKPTEYLILVKRYLQQAQELVALAGSQGVIRVSNCAEAKPLLTIIGYRFRETCGPDTSLETDDPDRAFLTVDSGFPLVDLEEALRAGKTFSYPFSSSQVPVVLAASDWTGIEAREKKDKKYDVVESILANPFLARLYWALSQMDSETDLALRQSPGLEKLLPDAGVLDFFGRHISVRSGRMVVPGGTSSEAAWAKLVGASPEAPGEFVAQLLTKDNGWVAAYYDALARVTLTQQGYLAAPQRLQRFYDALRGKDPSPGPGRPAFRPDAGMLLLVTQLQLDSRGQPNVPGNLEVWKKIFPKNDSKAGNEWIKRTGSWDSPDQLMEGMFAFSRDSKPDGPLQIYLKLSAIDRGRTLQSRLSPETVNLLAAKFSRFGDQYMIFSEFHGLNDASIEAFLKVADNIDRIRDHNVRANALGIFQSNVGLWQIVARQGQIPAANLNASWQDVVTPFTKVVTPTQVLDAAQSSLGKLLTSAGARPDISQATLVDLLTGPREIDQQSRQVWETLANKIRSAMQDQHLVPLDTLFALGNGLNQMAQGSAADKDHLVELVGELREFEMPRPIFTSTEKAEWASEHLDDGHIALQARTDLAKVIASPASPKALDQARGELIPFLRDTLVGLNYAYFEPLGSQMLHHNPLFVRSHDFSGEMTMGGEQSWRTPSLFGRGQSAGGGAHLAGSLADLPYALAKAEQDFVVPQNVQALIWDEMVPGLMTSAMLPRWWGISQNELHAVTLYQRTGEELLAAAGGNEQQRHAVMNILSDHMLPQRLERVEKELRAGKQQELLAEMTPSEIFYLAAEYRRTSAGKTTPWGPAGTELETLSHCCASDVSWERLSKDFGVPHPVLSQSYAGELLNLPPFPAVRGYSSRLLSESWESSNLYWGRLADEMGYSPVMLNQLVPTLTQRMIEKIFATDLEDWPAVLRAMRETGDEFRRAQNASIPKVGTVPAP